MGLFLKEDKTSLPFVTVSDAYIRIDCIVGVNPAEPYIERGPNKKITTKIMVPVSKTDKDGTITTEQEEQDHDEEVPGDIIKKEKRYSANVRLQFFSEGREGSYAARVVTIENLKQDEWTLPNLYERIKELPGFEESISDQ